MSTIRLRKKRRNQSNLRRPFDPVILAKARDLALSYQVLIWFEDGEYFGRGLELPFTLADGKTPEECFASVREAMTGTVAHMIERNEVPPAPASDAGRTEQVNIRLSRREKLLMEESARAKGFRGIADYVRARVLSGG